MIDETSKYGYMGVTSGRFLFHKQDTSFMKSRNNFLQQDFIKLMSFLGK